MEIKNKVDTGTFVFFIKYRKLLVILCVFVLAFALPVQIYNAPIFDQRHKYEDIGFLFDTVLIGLAAPVWMLIKIRKAYKAYNIEEEWKKL